MQQFTFSILIPTYNRLTYLEDTLSYIAKLAIQPIEIIVVDASQPEFQLREETIKKYPLLQYIKWPEYGNISKQRNHGIGLAKGNYILFLDDDVTFESDLIANYITAFDETNADGISGLVETTKYRKGSKAFFYKEVLQNTFEKNIQACDFIAPTKLICTASFAIKTNVLKAVGGFDELQRGTFDDIELGFRLAKEKYSIMHHPLPVVFHIQASASGARDSKHGNSWGLENQIYFMLKHVYPNREKWFLFKLMFETIRPSRAWLKPFTVLQRAKMRYAAYKRYFTLK